MLVGTSQLNVIVLMSPIKFNLLSTIVQISPTG